MPTPDVQYVCGNQERGGRDHNEALGQTLTNHPTQDEQNTRDQQQPQWQSAPMECGTADKSERAESQGDAHQDRLRPFTEPDGQWKGDQEEWRGDAVDGA